MARFLRAPVVAFVVGLLSTGAALAGIAVGTSGLDDLEPPPVPVPTEAPKAPSTSGKAVPAMLGGTPLPFDVELAPDEIARAANARVQAPLGDRLPPGRYLVGAARASLTPAPELFGGETWQKEGCTDIDAGTVDGDHLLPPIDPGDPVETLDEIRSWPASSPDCIYLGGFGIGPVRPATRVGHGGVWARVVAVANGERTFLYGIADTVGWFARYDQTICADCGIRDVRERLASDLGIDVGDVIVGSTHTHAGADTYGGWGGIPDWYRAQIRDATIGAAKQAVANLQPATVEVGEVHLRDRNNERRDTYYSTADTGASWIQARAGKRCVGRRCWKPVIATWATYAGHPTIVGESILHADWPGAAARRFESIYGGVGLLFEGGLGNVSITEASGDTDEESAENTGRAFADAVAHDIKRGGALLASNEMAAAAQDITHPASTNPALVTLATVGLFDRELTPGTAGAGIPGVYHGSRAGELSSSGEDNDPRPDGALLRGCTSAGPTVVTTTGAHRIGEMIVAFAPGEIFSNIAEVVKERADRTIVTVVLGQTNDALGYIIQSIEYDLQGNIVTEYGTGTGEYEEVFSIDRCFGDHVLEAMLESTRRLGAGG